MKRIQIDIRVDEVTGQIATAFATDGYSRENIGDLFEMIGIVENFKANLNDKIKMKLEKHI